MKAMVPGKTMSTANVFYVSHWGEEIVTIITTKVSPHSFGRAAPFKFFQRDASHTQACVRLD